MPNPAVSVFRRNDDVAVPALATVFAGFTCADAKVSRRAAARALPSKGDLRSLAEPLMRAAFSAAKGAVERDPQASRATFDFEGVGDGPVTLEVICHKGRFGRPGLTIRLALED